MKKIIFVLTVVFPVLAISACESENTLDPGVADIHNSQNSLDWGGLYTGMIPGANSRTKTTLTLNYDNSYKMTYQYIDKSNKVYTDKGTFKWDNTGGIIILDRDDGPFSYRVGENMLFQLDMEGNIITGKLADMYILTKISK